MTETRDEQLARELAKWFAKKYMEPKRAPTYSPVEMEEQIAQLVARVRLEEAEWWADAEHKEHSEECAECPFCHRLAAHRRAAEKE